MSNYYQIYRRDILTLAKSLVIKHHDIAVMTNKGLEREGYLVTEENPRRWKYYLNLSGEYHETDQMIYVRSIDTLESIPFTKESLSIHKATRREYLPGGRFHERILTDYPNMTSLIRGVLNPVNIDVALTVEDGKILSFDANMVESNEYYLIKDLQDWVYGYYARWYNPQYNLLDDLYLPLFLGQLYLNIVPAIERLRFQRVNTREAHSFHVREYLGSNGGLDRYLPYLTKEQTLWLYRNIRFVRDNIGKQQTFKTLIHQILTKRNMPLQGYSLSHDYEEMALGDSLYADVYMKKEPINVNYIQSGVERERIRTILSRQNNIARDNLAIINDADRDITQRASRSMGNRYPTKVLESEIVDRSNSSVRSLNSVLLNEWLHLIQAGRYTGFITFNHPVSSELLTISVKDAFIIALYCALKLDGQETDIIPAVYAYDVLRIPLPSRQELFNSVDNHYLPDGFIDAVRDRISPLGSYVTPDEFYDACFRLHDEYLRLWELYSFQEHYMTRGYAEQLVKLHFMHIKCHLTDPALTFDDWIADKGIQLMDLSITDYGEIFNECVQRSTGANIRDRRSLSEIQRMLLSLMGELSSYGVHYIQNINTSDFFFVADPAARVGDYTAKQFVNTKIPQPIIAITDYTAKHKHSLHVKSEDLDPPISTTSRERSRVTASADVGVRMRTRYGGRIAVNIDDVGVRIPRDTTEA